MAKSVGSSGKAGVSTANARTVKKAAPRLTTSMNSRATHKPTTEAEQGLLNAVDGNGGYNAGHLAKPQRIVRSAFLRDLLLSRIDGKIIPEEGLRTFGLIFSERLHLEHLSRQGEPLPQLWLDEALFENGASFSDSTISLLSLDGSTSKAEVSLERIHTVGNVTLEKASITGGLVLRSATIGGALNLNGAHLSAEEGESSDGTALSADGFTVGGSLFCDKSGKRSFETSGSLRLQGAEIRGQLSFKGAVLRAVPKKNVRFSGDAIVAERIQVGDALFLDDGVKVEGRVNFAGAKLSDVSIKGQFKSHRDSLDLSDVEVRRLRVRLERSACRGRFMLEGAQADTVDGLDPKHWGCAAGEDASELELDFDGFVYRRAEVSHQMPTQRTRQWAKFWFRDPVAENVLDLLDSSFKGDKPNEGDYRPQPFEQAAKALREAGYDRAANEVAVAKREFKRKCRADGKLAAFMARLSVTFFRYGYGPLRAAAWTTTFILVGAWAFSAIGEGRGLVVADTQDRGAMVTTRLRSGPCRVAPVIPDISGCARATHKIVALALNTLEQPIEASLNAALGTPAGSLRSAKAMNACPVHPISLAIDTFLPLVDFGVDKRCRIADDYPRRGLAETFRIAYAILGWLFIPMVALTFAGVLRKD